MAIVVEKQPDEATGPDAADPHHLEGVVFQVVAIEEDPALIRKDCW